MKIKDDVCMSFSATEDLMFGQRMTYIIGMKGVSKAWIAEKLGISKQALNYLLKHALKPKFVDEFAELLEIDPEWIETGKGTPSIRKPIPKQENQIPIVKKEAFIHSTPLAQSAKEFVEFASDGAESAVAYRLLDNSNFPPFIKSSVLIFDLQKTARNGDYVLALIDGDLIVRQYVIDGNNTCYKTSSAEHKTYINPSAKIIGVLLEARYLLD